MEDILFAAIILGIVLLFCDILFIALGLNYMRSKVPLGFYTGEKPPKPEEISDITAWNRKHGISLFVYAGIMTVSFVLSLFTGLIAGVVIILIGTIGGGIGLILYHCHLSKVYRIRN